MAKKNVWRWAGPAVKFAFVDSRAGLTLLPALIGMRWIGVWAWVIAGLVFALFAVLERFGFSPQVALRFLRSWLAGPVRHAVAWWHKPQKKY